MIIYTRVVAAPKDITQCEARLTDIPEVGAAAKAPTRAVLGNGEKLWWFSHGCHPWQELDVDLKCTNKESPEELGSPLVPVWSPGCPSCCLYSRICGLQKLRVRAMVGRGWCQGHSMMKAILGQEFMVLVSLQQELAFTVCLQYRYQGMDDFVEERQQVNVGRPLIAKLNLQASPPPPHSPLFSSSPRSWGLVESSWVNTPEENLSPEGPSSDTL